MRGSKLKPPTLLFPDTLIFDDGKHRVELRHFGTAHTKGDGVAWLPKEKILFTGDVAVNGAYNFVGDGDVASWIGRWPASRAGRAKVGPGHGPLGDASVLAGSGDVLPGAAARRCAAASKGQTPEAVQAAIPSMRARDAEEQPDRPLRRRRLPGAGRQGLHRDDGADAARSAGGGAGRADARRVAPRACARELAPELKVVAYVPVRVITAVGRTGR